MRALPLLSTSGGGTNDQASDSSALITVDEVSLRLISGETVTVMIQIAMRENVLWLPPAALRMFQSSDFVPVQNGDVQQRVKVQIGLRSTGELDSETTHQIFALFRYLVEAEKITVLAATHDPIIDEYVDTILNLKDGLLLR